jgi:2-polyprenyl-3-methyl-5-hydroxy-6-metoxy-1,4-benzoquinol methylase
MSSSPTYLDPIVIPLVIGETVLDVGCGYGRWANLIHSNFWEAGLLKPPQVDGLDAFQPNVDFCTAQGRYRNVWYQELPSQITGSWDTVLACEIIEHLAQDKVEEMLKTLESVAKKRIIVSTPNFPYYRTGGDTILGFNDFEAHLSYLSRDFFRHQGYKIIGAGFGNPRNLIFRAVRKINLNFRLAWQSLPVLFPALGESIVAYKDIT